MEFKKNNRSRNFFIANLIVLGITIGFILAFVGGRSLGFVSRDEGLSLPILQAETPRVQVAPEIGAALSQAEAVQNAFRYVAAMVQPSVVELEVVEKAMESPKTQESIPFEFFFGPNEREDGPSLPYQNEGLGSGVIVKREGKTVYLLTNDHVAGKADKIRVIMSDGRKFDGTLVGTDARKDIALVKFETQDANIKVATLGDSSSIQVGDWAIAVGSPLGLVSSVTAGIVSAVGRDGGPGGNINDFIQTDAAINKGNSGGALVNIRGEVVGINTWIASTTGGSIGLGFAIPINNVKGAIDDFINHKQIRYGWLGVSLLGVTADAATAKELKVDSLKGAFVAQVFKNGPADKGGILPGDFVTAVGGQPVKSQDELVRRVGDIPAGTVTTIDVVRAGKAVSLKVKIDLRDPSVASNNKDLFPGVSVLSLASDSIDPKRLPKGVGKGVLVTEVIGRSPASVIGVKARDIIIKVNDKPVESVLDFYSLLNDPKERKLRFTVVRDEQTIDTLAFNKD
jgi:Do/DeqQ family serine protease